jgi:hypothetical protein
LKSASLLADSLKASPVIAERVSTLHLAVPPWEGDTPFLGASVKSEANDSTGHELNRISTNIIRIAKDRF